MASDPQPRSKPQSRISPAGFTALELLITLAIVGIVASLAIPALRDFVLDNRAIGHINAFAAAVDFAATRRSDGEHW